MRDDRDRLIDERAEAALHKVEGDGRAIGAGWLRLLAGRGSAGAAEPAVVRRSMGRSVLGVYGNVRIPCGGPIPDACKTAEGMRALYTPSGGAAARIIRYAKALWPDVSPIQGKRTVTTTLLCRDQGILTSGRPAVTVTMWL